VRKGSFWTDKEGAAAVEFAMVATPFVAILLGALQLSVLFLGQQMLETAAESAGRLILTGNVTNSNTTQQQFLQDVCAALPALFSCSGIMVDVQVASAFASANTAAPTLTYDNKGNVSNAWAFDTGSPGNIIVMRLMYQWPMLNVLGFNLATLPSSARLIMATAVFKNESYSQ
jgi:Flp pilus assembly protein TadG